MLLMLYYTLIFLVSMALHFFIGPIKELDLFDNANLSCNGQYHAYSLLLDNSEQN